MPIGAAIRLRAKTIVTSLSHGIYSDRLKSNIIINLCVTRVTLVLHKDRIALCLRYSKMESVPTKILGRATFTN